MLQLAVTRRHLDDHVPAGLAKDSESNGLPCIRLRFNPLAQPARTGFAVRLTHGRREPVTIRATLEAAREMAFPPQRLMFEVTESEQVRDHARLKHIFVEYRRQGFTTAIDDFGAGHSGLNLLADFQPDIVKLDMALTRGVDTDRVRRAIVSGIVRLCEELEIRVIAEGIETTTECLALQDEGISLFQGYLFARPGFESLPVVPAAVWPTVKPRRAVDRRRR
jgi:EAL domain-containing protein (putative c-di-GMP-specific phosphodiesterase class I)